MRPARVLVVYLAVVLIGGALLAPGLYGLAQGLAESFPTHPTLQKLAGMPFHRYVNRSLLGLAFLGLWPLLRSLEIKSWNELGLANPVRHWRPMLAALALGFGSLAATAALTLAAGARQVNPEIPVGRLGERLGAAALSAGVVALLEEVLFRAGVFGGLRKGCRWQTALGISSVIYAIVHFFRRSEAPGEIDWATGFVVLVQMLGGFFDARQVVPGFLNLTVAGALLALAYQRTGNLYFSIGLHAGWIFWLKSYGWLTREVPGSSIGFWGTGKLIDGWLAFGVLILCWPVVGRLACPGEAVPRERN